MPATMKPKPAEKAVTVNGLKGDKPAGVLPASPGAEPSGPARKSTVNTVAKSAHTPHVPHVPPLPQEKQEDEVRRKHDIPSKHHDPEEEGVIGEVDRPAQPSEKPEAL